MCDRGTDEHSEYGLLEEMSRRYGQDVGAPPLLVGAPSVARKAALQELEVHLVLQPDSEADTVVGYIAFSSKEDRVQEAGDVLPAELIELYIEPDFRRRGIATAALAVLLARQDVVRMRAAAGDRGDEDLAGGALGPGRIAAQVLARLGFRRDFGGASAVGLGADQALYRRGRPLFDGTDDENVR